MSARKDEERQRRLAKAAVALNADVPDWRSRLICTGQGVPRPLEGNLAPVLQPEPAFVGSLRWNELSHAVECSFLPWRQTRGWREWTDTDDVELAIWCQQRGLAAKPTTCASAVQAVATKS